MFPLDGYAVGLKVGGQTVWFRPLPDITAYELALCLTVLAAATAGRSPAEGIADAYRKLPPDAARHFSG